jgi:hypothetical protein
MFPLIPYKHISIATSLGIDEAVTLISNSISPRGSWFQWPAKGGKEFEGKVSSEGFTINRVIRYRNSFLPIMYGRFTPTDNGVRVIIHMTMHPLVIGFSILWCAGVASWSLVSIGSWIATGNLDQVGLIPLAMLALFYLMTFFGFGFEANKAERFVTRLFESNRIA